MSRSIHETRHELHDAWLSQYARAEQRRAQLRRLRAALRKKRAIKRAVGAERAAPAGAAPHGDLDTIPIRVLDEGPFIHYPASPDDIRNVMRLLPPGSLDGMRSIDLQLGSEAQAEYDENLKPDPDLDLEPDPHLGSLGDAVLPGIYSGWLLATYLCGRARVQLFAYVYDDTWLAHPWRDLYLRLKMLGSFVHEVAHHDDWTRRVGRGRWGNIGDDEETGEIYAQRFQHDWLHRYVVPYLEQTYPEQSAALRGWIREQGGVELTLADLAGDPRVRAKVGLTRLDSATAASAFNHVVESVLAGESALQRSIQFAEDLHYADLDAQARSLIDRILIDDPERLDVRCLLACLHNCNGDQPSAQVVAEGTLLIDPACVKAWRQLARAHRWQEHWSELLVAASRLMELEGSGSFRNVQALEYRALARLGLDNLAGCREDLEALRARGTSFAAKRASVVEEELKAREQRG